MENYILMFMKIIVAHKSCDMDAISSVWLIKRYLPGWENAKVKFVVAGEKLPGKYTETGNVIERINDDEVIHVDTGLGKLDHHQIYDVNVSAASLSYDFILKEGNVSQNEIKRKALEKIVDLVVENDHFQEVFKAKQDLESCDFSLFALIDGIKLRYPGEEERFVEFGMDCLDSFLVAFENRIWAESEIADNGIIFETKWGKGIAVETPNDYVLELGQKTGYIIVIRKDPHNGFVRIKAMPQVSKKYKEQGIPEKNIDLTFLYENLKKLDPYATWFLHISKRMLLNGSSKNPNAISTKLSLPQIIEAIKNG